MKSQEKETYETLGAHLGGFLTPARNPGTLARPLFCES